MDYPLKVSAFGGFSFEGEDFSFLLPPYSFLEKFLLLPRLPTFLIPHSTFHIPQKILPRKIPPALDNKKGPT
jgi:hypothetical protein